MKERTVCRWWTQTRALGMHGCCNAHSDSLKSIHQLHVSKDDSLLSSVTAFSRAIDLVSFDAFNGSASMRIETKIVAQCAVAFEIIL